MKTDQQLISEIKSGENISESFKELSSRHSALFFKIASKYISKNFKEKRIEFFKDKDYYIYISALDYNESKGTKFSTYLANRVKWICINNYKKNIKEKDVPLNEEIKSPCSEDYFLKKYNIDYQDCLKILKSFSDTRVYEIFKLRYMQGKKNKLMPWKDVAKSNNVNLSIQGCINIHNKTLDKLQTIK